jgi:hypothetical protein
MELASSIVTFHNFKYEFITVTSLENILSRQSPSPNYNPPNKKKDSKYYLKMFHQNVRTKSLVYHRLPK